MARRSGKHYTAPRTRRYVPRRTRWIIGLSALAVILIGLLIAAFLQGWVSLPETWPWEQDPAATEPIHRDPDTVIHLVAGGDVNITDKVIASGGSSYDYSAVLRDVLPALSGADLTVLNFEGNVYSDADSVSAPPQLLQALHAAGADVLQTANSHSITNGLLGLAATNNAIRIAGMQPLGTYANEAEFERHQGYLIYEVQGIKIALVAFTKGMDGRNLEEEDRHCVNLLYTDYSTTYKDVDEDGITKVIRAAQRENPDLVIAMLHWGGEKNDQISATQKKIVSVMKKLGVDAIIGTHSHHVQQMGFDEDNEIFVAYSLGDLMGDADSENTRYSALLDLTITKDGGTGKVSITGYDYVPVYLHYDEQGHLTLLRIREAMAAYESNYIGRVPEDVYNAMKTALARIEKRVKG